MRTPSFSGRWFQKFPDARISPGGPFSRSCSEQPVTGDSRLMVGITTRVMQSAVRAYNGFQHSADNRIQPVCPPFRVRHVTSACLCRSPRPLRKASRFACTRLANQCKALHFNGLWLPGRYQNDPCSLLPVQRRNRPKPVRHLHQAGTLRTASGTPANLPCERYCDQHSERGGPAPDPKIGRSALMQPKDSVASRNGAVRHWDYYRSVSESSQCRMFNKEFTQFSTGLSTPPEMQKARPQGRAFHCP